MTKINSKCKTSKKLKMEDYFNMEDDQKKLKWKMTKKIKMEDDQIKT